MIQCDGRVIKMFVKDGYGISSELFIVYYCWIFLYEGDCIQYFIKLMFLEEIFDCRNDFVDFVSVCFVDVFVDI